MAYRRYDRWRALIASLISPSTLRVERYAGQRSERLCCRPTRRCMPVVLPVLPLTDEWLGSIGMTQTWPLALSRDCERPSDLRQTPSSDEKWVSPAQSVAVSLYAAG